MWLRSGDQWMRLGVFGLVLALLLTIFTEDQAMARRRRGRGMRRGAAARVRGRGRRGRRGRGRARRRNNFNDGQIAAVDNGGVQDFGIASAVAPGSAFDPTGTGIGLGGFGAFNGLRPIDKFGNLAIDSRGQFFELNPNAVQNGIIVDPSTGVRQPIVSLNGQLITGSNGQLLPDTLSQVRAFNQGDIPVSLSLRGDSEAGVVSLRRR